MRQRDIDAALERLEEYGGADDAAKLIIAVVETKPDKSTWNELAEIVADGRMEDAADVKRELREHNAKLGFLMRADDAKRYGVWEADHVFLYMDGGEIYGYEHSGNVAYVRDEDYTLRGASAVDQYAEMVSLDEAVNQILGW